MLYYCRTYASTALYFDRGAHFATLLWLSIEYLLDAALALACELTELPFPVQSAESKLTTTLAPRLPSSVVPSRVTGENAIPASVVVSQSRYPKRGEEMTTADHRPEMSSEEKEIESERARVNITFIVSLAPSSVPSVERTSIEWTDLSDLSIIPRLSNPACCGRGSSSTYLPTYTYVTYYLRLRATLRPAARRWPRPTRASEMVRAGTPAPLPRYFLRKETKQNAKNWISPFRWWR